MDEFKKEKYIHKKFDHDRSLFCKDINIAARSFTIANEIAAGLSYRLIAAKYMKEWNVSQNYMRYAITEAIDMFNNENIYKNLKEINNERLNNIYADAKNSGKLAEAIKAIDVMNKMNNIYNEPPKTQVNVNTDDTNVTVTFGGVSVIDTIKQPIIEEAEFNIVEDILKNEDKDKE